MAALCRRRSTASVSARPRRLWHRATVAVAAAAAAVAAAAAIWVGRGACGLPADSSAAGLVLRPRRRQAALGIIAGTAGVSGVASQLAPPARAQAAVAAEAGLRWLTPVEARAGEALDRTSLEDYAAMRDDEERTSKYAVAIRRALAQRPAGSTVVADIGTGPFALLAVIAARTGAKRVYAIERSADAAARARLAVEEAGLAGTIQVIEGESTAVSLPERVDLVVSEVIGNIALGEGAVATIRDARRRLLREGERGLAGMIPSRCQTMIAPVNYANHALLSARGAGSLRPFKLFSETQDLTFLSEPQALEDFDFRSPKGPGEDDLREASELHFDVAPAAAAAAGGLSGFALWPRVDLDGQEIVDIKGRRSHWSFVVVLTSPLPEVVGEPGKVLLRSDADIRAVPYRYSFRAAIAT
mmetsp:Transcript_44030/g.141186  ORF Transcript_44030/g.141186 Transcript_44030/m.141186 type:complete len:415 (-) Transcript_44030:38-1282(-)